MRPFYQACHPIIFPIHSQNYTYVPTRGWNRISEQIMLFIDYSSVFNTIVPTKLFTKLRTLGLNTSLCNWILEFLTGRPQVVRVGNNTSAKLILNTGAPRVRA